MTGAGADCGFGAGGLRRSERQPCRPGMAASVAMRLDPGAEHAHRTLDEAHRAVWVVAGAAAADLAAPAQQSLPLAGVSAAVGERRERVGDCRQAEHAGTALARRGVCEIVDHA